MTAEAELRGKEGESVNCQWCSRGFTSPGFDSPHLAFSLLLLTLSARIEIFKSSGDFLCKKPGCSGAKNISAMLVVFAIELM